MAIRHTEGTALLQGATPSSHPTMESAMELPRSKRASLAYVLSSLITLLAFPAHAVDSSPYLFGDWNGERTRLAEQGITFQFGYTSEAAHNFSGGTRHTTRYADQWLLGSTFDLDKLLAWRGATFDLAITNRNGRNLGQDADLGVYEQVQEIYGRGQTWLLTTFALTQKLFDGELEWRIGRLPVGADFDDFSCDFQNLTFCGSQPGNIVGDYWYNWPVSQWATTVKWHTSDQTYVKLGAYQLNPLYVDNTWARSNGWKVSFPGGTTGALLPLEFGWTPTIGGLPGNYKLGGWYNNAGGENLYYDANHQPMALTGEAPLQESARHGGYVSLQQQISGDAGGEGVSLFFNATMADGATSAVDRQFALGAMFDGPFGRIDDRIGVAVGATHGSNELARYARLYNLLHPDAQLPVADTYELAAEVFYDWRPIPSLSLRPNLQYLADPGGSTQNRNAFVLGLKTSIAF
jgi:porin